MHFDKITKRLQTLCGDDLDPELVDPVLVAQKVVAGLYKGVTTVELDNLAAETAAFLSTTHPGYGTLAARVLVSNLHKTTPNKFSKVVHTLHTHVHSATGTPATLVNAEVADFVRDHADALDGMIDYNRDYLFDFFGVRTLEKTYLVRVHGAIAERPQHMFMRVAVQLHMPDLERVRETYDLLSHKHMIHATPTLYNACSPRPQMSSCFLVRMKADSIEGIFKTLTACATISKYAGGLGLAIHNIRATGSFIAGTNGTSNGLVPMLKVYSDMAAYVDQGGGKRKGSMAVYLEPWHADVLEFLVLRKNHGAEEARARNLFPALWVPDLFMRRVETDAAWSLFCPMEAPGLNEVYGEEFDALYAKYEAAGKARRQMPARALWDAILQNQVETGTPYILYKDACNRKSNQRHLGTIQCSNLCTEIIQYTSDKEIAVCNLASLSLPSFVDKDRKVFDWDRFAHVVRVATRNLNQVIDRSFYPAATARASNLRHRPIGLGVQGLADVFALLRLPFEGPDAAALNKDIFEALYYNALLASCELAQRDGPYDSYPGSPLSQGLLQQDLWGVSGVETPKWDWAQLRARIAAYGVRNSLLVAPMPTASTAQILGNNEAFEPFTSNMFTRRVLAGEFVVMNKHLVSDLLTRGLWTKDMRTAIIANRGSVQRVPGFPEDLKPLYKTVWEMSMKSVIDQARDRGPFVDQSQSLNLFIADPSPKKLTSMHFYSWKAGLKTGMYYLRTLPKADPIQFTIDPRVKATSAPVFSQPSAGAAGSTCARSAGSGASAGSGGSAGSASAGSGGSAGSDDGDHEVCHMCSA
jgi:ribonucleoside-diphosphate reductase alpha subunit